MADKPKTLTELIEAVQPITTGEVNEADTEELAFLLLTAVKELQALTIATAKAVQELWEHQHQHTDPANWAKMQETTKPIGYGSKK